MHEWMIFQQAQADLIPPLVRGLAVAYQSAPDAAVADHLTAFMDGIVKLREPAETLYRHTWEQLAANRLDDEEAAGLLLKSAFDRIVGEIEMLRSHLPAELCGQLADLDGAEKSFRGMRDHLNTEWPWIDHRMIAQASAAHERGEFREAGDILRELQNAHTKTA